MEQSTNESGLNIARVASLTLLAVVGITALLGGSALIIDPSGQSMSLAPEGLAGTMFHDYRAPGVILFLMIGVLSSSVAVLTAGNFKNYPILVFNQGAILTGWILAQIYLLPETHFMQAIYGIFGVMLMLLGSYLMIKKNNMKTLY
jgi:hypothetical protein